MLLWFYLSEKRHFMKLNIFTKLLGTIFLTITVASASTLTELQGTKGLAEADLKAKTAFKTIFKNERVDNKYYKSYKEKNLDLLNFYTVADIKALHELLIANPDFATYAPFTILAYKNLKKEKDSDTTWYEHLATNLSNYVHFLLDYQSQQE